MKIVGITGGIGSGKTTVCKVFESLGIPVYYADTAAKGLYTKDLELKKQMIDHFGQEIYLNDSINREKLSSIVFSDPVKLDSLNSIVHPAVKRDFQLWLGKQKASSYVLKEAAILIESGSYKDCDSIIVVQASVDERLNRVCNRDGVSKDLVIERMNNQMSDEERGEFADFIIENGNDSLIIPQVLGIHDSILT